MKSHSFLHSAATSLAVLALGAGSWGIARAQSPQYVQVTPTPVAVQIATSEMGTFALSQVAGKPVRGNAGADFGQITDFLADPRTGTIHFAMVPSGGGPEGNTYRLVPLGAMDLSNNDAFIVRLGRGQWDRVDTLIESRLQGRITLDPDLRARLGEQYNLNGEPAEDVQEFVRVSQLRGRPVQSGNEQLGVVEDVLVDVRHRTAAVLLSPANAFGGTAQRYLVPFQQLQLDAAGTGAIVTTLTRAQFQQLQPNLSPTGYTGYNTNAGFTPAAGRPFTNPTTVTQGQTSAAQAASAVQQALSGQAAGVQVIPESRIVLRGTVESQQQKMEIERTAVQAASGVPVENQLTVRRW